MVVYFTEHLESFFVEPCLRQPLVIAPVLGGGSPLFKAPAPQGWDARIYHVAVDNSSLECEPRWRSWAGTTTWAFDRAPDLLLCAVWQAIH